MHQLSHIYDTNNQITGIKLTFENFKHNYNQHSACTSFRFLITSNIFKRTYGTRIYLFSI